MSWSIRAIMACAMLAVLLQTGGHADAAIPKWREWDLDVPFLHAGEPGPEAIYPEIMGSGTCIFDHDGDGWEDVLMLNAQYSNTTLQRLYDPASALYRNVGGASLVRVPGVLELRGWTMGCATGDHDKDGDIDVAVNTWGAGVLLYRNDGAGVFTNITAAAGLGHGSCGESACFGVSVAWIDHDKDADLDLYAQNYLNWDGVGVAAPFYQGQCNVLYRNNGDSTFTNITEAANAGDCGGNHLAVAIADVDGDGWQDIFSASDETIDSLLMNNGDGTFREVGPAAGVDDPRGGMGAAWGDYDGDGRYDLVITHFESERFALYRQNADFTFTDRAELNGLDHTRNYVGWGVEFADLDADGPLDLVMVNGHVNVSYARGGSTYGQRDLVLRNEDGKFVDVTNDTWAGVREEVSRGFALGDLNADGYLDAVVMNNANQTGRVWRSDRAPNNWLTLRLDGNATVNPQALGAVVTLTLEGGTTVRREVVGATSYLSQSSRDLHFGLGNAQSITSIVVVWPDGSKQTFGATDANQALSLKAGGTLVARHSWPIAGAAPTATGERLAPITLTGEIVRAPATVASTAWIIGGVEYPGMTVQHAFADGGVHEARFRVVDVEGHVDEAVTTVSISNLAPTARIVAPSEVLVRVPTLLDGSTSSDDAGVVNWTWRVGGLILYGKTVTHTFGALGPHVVELEVADAEGAKATTAVTLSVHTVPPIPVPGRPRVGPPGHVFTFVSESSDPDGSVAEWRWNFGDGTQATCTPAGCTGAGPGVDAAIGRVGVRKSYATEGVRNVTLAVEDDLGVVSNVTITATIHAGIELPIVQLAAPVRADRLSAAQFDASASHDPDGTIVLYEWELGDGRRVECVCPTFTHAYRNVGSYVVNVTVIDDEGAWSETSSTVAVVNLAPTLEAPATLVHERSGTLRLSARGSDPEGTALTWVWNPGDGSAPLVGREVEHAYAALGNYVATVSATDAEGATTTSKIDVLVRARPLARVVTPAEGLRNVPMTLDGSLSEDADGDIVSWRWTLGDGSTGDGAIVRHAYRALGSYIATLTVTDQHGFSSTTSQTVRIVNAPPVAAIVGHASANLGQPLVFRSASVDPDGQVVLWSWEIDGKIIGNASDATHAFQTLGKHAVRLRVQDADGGSDVAEMLLTVVLTLDVTVRMTQDTYSPTQTPEGTVVVRYANGAPVPGAAANVSITYQARSARGEIAFYAVRVAGETDGNGTFTFSVPTPMRSYVGQAPIQVANLPPVHTLARTEHAVQARVTWGANGGVDATSYVVEPAPPRIETTPPRRLV